MAYLTTKLWADLSRADIDSHFDRSCSLMLNMMFRRVPWDSAAGLMEGRSLILQHISKDGRVPVGIALVRARYCIEPVSEH